MDVVVTGASGLVGQAVVRQLRAAGHQALALSRRPAPGVTVVREYREAPAAHALVHLAEIADRGAAEAAGPAYEMQAAATLAALLTCGYQRVVYASSGVLYGDRQTAPCRVGTPVEAHDRYSRIKINAEAAVLARQEGAVARLANLYGPGTPAGTVLGTILSQIPGAGPLQVQDDTPVRDYIWVDDAAEALAAIAVNGTANGIFNVGTGVGTSVRELARAALAIAGESRRPIVATAPRGIRSSLVLSIADTCGALPWRPRTPLAEGLSRLVRSRAPEVE